MFQHQKFRKNNVESTGSQHSCWMQKISIKFSNCFLVIVMNELSSFCLPKISSRNLSRLNSRIFQNLINIRNDNMKSKVLTNFETSLQGNSTKPNVNIYDITVFGTLCQVSGKFEALKSKVMVNQFYFLANKNEG